MSHNEAKREHKRLIRILEKGKIFGINEIRGITLGKAILIKREYYTEALLCHELIHVKQYQDYGSMKKFIKQYEYEISK